MWDGIDQLTSYILWGLVLAAEKTDVACKEMPYLVSMLAERDYRDMTPLTRGQIW
jgi:hypothetical protein